jgi:hypothetical protein
VLTSVKLCSIILSPWRFSTWYIYQWYVSFSFYLLYKIVQSSKFRFKVESHILSWGSSLSWRSVVPKLSRSNSVVIPQVGSFEVRSFEVQLVNSLTELRTTQLGGWWLNFEKVMTPNLEYDPQLQKFNNDIIKPWNFSVFSFLHSNSTFSLSMFSTFRYWVIRCWFPIRRWIQFDV